MANNPLIQEKQKEREQMQAYLESLPATVYEANFETYRAAMEALDWEIDALVEAEEAQAPVIGSAEWFSQVQEVPVDA